ncbi:Phosphatidylinositol:ceramide inositolphosphotransferase [Acorus calamus]|uniref:Phosphatidylinositol:ceramide inositolphosphotransferase n=1 Tax=Acorus calamus TaxID=4465 RepID=A0AAV9DDF9_ACOCL|nr:Phosphatidylinositol:ceramide inositolphosphotransferase [Acorus calamus]
MTFYVAREGSKYIHGLAARGVHYLHRPGPILQDVGVHKFSGSLHSIPLSFLVQIITVERGLNLLDCLVQIIYWKCSSSTVAWLIAIIQSLLIIASRKHYTVDVVVAWYTVNLVVFFVDKKLPEMPDRGTGTSPPLLPVSAKDKDSKSKEEQPLLLNGNSLESSDRRPRTQVNGKHLDDTNPVNGDAAMNST